MSYELCNTKLFHVASVSMTALRRQHQFSYGPTCLRVEVSLNTLWLKFHCFAALEINLYE